MTQLYNVILPPSNLFASINKMKKPYNLPLRIDKIPLNVFLTDYAQIVK
jgi:hypothetical protein